MNSWANCVEGILVSEVAIVAIGHSRFGSSTPSVSFKEMMFEAATMAYEDARIDPRKDVQSFVCCTEDFWEGNSISDEYMPDQLGAALRPLCTVASDGLFGISTAYMQIKSGLADIVVVEAHSKSSDVETKTQIEEYALDPIFLRPLELHPLALAGLEMKVFLRESGASVEDCAQVVVKNRRNAQRNPNAVYPDSLTVEDVLSSKVRFDPLKTLDVSEHADGSIVVVLASAHRARTLTDEPVWIEGLGWSSETSWVEARDWSKATYARLASDRAYKMAGIDNPSKQVDLAEIDDTYSYKELQHIESLRLVQKGSSGHLTEVGYTDPDGQLPVNVSGGSLGFGQLLEATGLQKVLEAVQQLRGNAKGRQVKNAKRALVQSWRGTPTATGAVAILSSR